MFVQSQEVCLEGFIMDQYCIDRGTLLDDPGTDTLDEPELHSVHCLVDISSCTNSGYEILTDPQPGSTKYCRTFRLDDAGETMAIALAREVGMCDTCSENGEKSEGFRATVVGTVQPTTDSDDVPPTLTVSQILENGTACSSLDGVEVLTDLPCITTSGRLAPIMRLHGSFMIIGWGLLLPTGVITARRFKHRPNAFWFRFHRGIQSTGLLLATIGVLIAIFNFTALSSPGTTAFIHGLLGITAMSIGLLQPVNAFFSTPCSWPRGGNTNESENLGIFTQG